MQQIDKRGGEKNMMITQSNKNTFQRLAQRFYCFKFYRSGGPLEAVCLTENSFDSRAILRIVSRQMFELQ